MSLDSVTRSLERHLPPDPPTPAPLGCRPGRLWGGRGHVRGPALVGSWGEPHLLAVPPPPTLEPLVLELEGNEECGKYLKAVASAGEVAGAAWGARGLRCSQRPCRKAAAGGPGPRGPPGSGGGLGAGGVGPEAPMALRCIVVEAAEVFQGCLVAELVLVLQEGPDGGSISASPDTSQGSRAPRGHAPQPVARTSDSTPVSLCLQLTTTAQRPPPD